MYWPNGVPRVYAVNGPDIAYQPSDLSREDAQDSSLEQRASIDTEDDGGEDNARTTNSYAPAADPVSVPEPPPETDKRKWENESILGLCASRSGHMFATMTETSLAIWQTRVCPAIF